MTMMMKCQLRHSYRKVTFTSFLLWIFYFFSFVINVDVRAAGIIIFFFFFFAFILSDIRLAFEMAASPIW